MQSVESFFSQIYTPAIKKLIYTRWNGIRKRCFEPTEPAYSSYGAKGITMIKEWQDLDCFADWVCLELSAFANDYDTPVEALHDLDIDRKDPFGDYTPENCQLLANKLNIHTTKFARFMIPYKDELLPCWAIERIVGVKEVSQRIREDSLRGKGVLTDFELFAKNAKYLYNRYGAMYIIEEVNYIVYYSFLKKPLVLDKEGKTHCPRCNVYQFHIHENKPDLSMFCDNCNHSVLLINGKNRKLDAQRHELIPQTYHKPEHTDLVMKYWNPYKTTPIERSKTKLLFKERQHQYKIEGEQKAEAHRARQQILNGENERKRNIMLKEIIAPYEHWKYTKVVDLHKLKEFIEANKKTLPKEAFAWLKMHYKRLKRIRSVNNEKRRIKERNAKKRERKLSVASTP